jgi:hypothetical protein
VEFALLADARHDEHPVTPGSVVKKLPVFDSSENSLGYIPIYDAITQGRFDRTTPLTRPLPQGER